MCARILFFVFLINAIGCQNNASDQEQNAVKLCSVCTCSEINDVKNDNVVLNIVCSELDKIVNMPDLFKIEWPLNGNALKISAAFESLGLSTLGKLPGNAFVESLRFYNNRITTYWPDPFSELPNLRKLSFAKNSLQVITEDLFTNIEDLEELDLSYNKLAEFKEKPFQRLNKLKRLNLQGNVFKSIPVDVLGNMTALEEIDLSKNQICDVLLKQVEDNVLKNVKRLYLNENRVRVLTKNSFPDSNSLELIDLSNNEIEMINEDTFIDCTSLAELNLGQNNITFNFILPKSLKILIMKQNTIHKWPTFPGEITYIDLSYNRLTDMFGSDNKFDYLEVLNLAGNQIKEIQIHNRIPKVYSLDISYNVLHEVPSSVNEQTFPALEELRLDGNPIDVIYFSAIISLRSLYMNDMSALTSVDDKAFSNVAGRFVEGGNERECFSLFLSNCKSLAEIKDGAFEGAPLCALDISNNNLSTLSPSLLDWKAVDEGINLQRNPWDCGCSFQWVLDKLLPVMYNKYAHFLSEFRCETPRGVQGLRVVHWLNWTDRAMCNDDYKQSAGDLFLLGSSTSQSTTSLGGLGPLTIILAVGIIVALLVVTALAVYLIKGHKRYRIRQSAMNRKRQGLKETQNIRNIQKEQIAALNKA